MLYNCTHVTAVGFKGISTLAVVVDAAGLFVVWPPFLSHAVISKWLLGGRVVIVVACY